MREDIRALGIQNVHHLRPFPFAREAPFVPGTRRVARVEENTAADTPVLTADRADRLTALEPAAGERHDEANKVSIDREGLWRRRQTGSLCGRCAVRAGRGRAC